jgi:hypothetical protein
MKTKAYLRTTLVWGAVAIGLVSAYPKDSLADKERGGGGIVHCNPTTIRGVAYSGYYALDYIAQIQVAHPSALAFNSTREALQNIVRKLKEDVPALGEHLEAFLHLYKSETMKNFRVWRGGEGPLVRIFDENLVRELPPACRETYQAIVRTPVKYGTDPSFKPSRIFYDYNPEVVSSIESKDLQLSFLLVHEWLRDFLDDAFQIRQLNWYLHSKEFMAASESDVLEALNGFSIRGVWLRPGEQIRRETEEATKTLQISRKGVEVACQKSDVVEFMKQLGDVIVRMDVGSSSLLDKSLLRSLHNERTRISDIQRMAMGDLAKAQESLGCSGMSPVN